MTVIAIDAMSGDHGLVTTIPAAANIAKSQPAIECILVGDEAVITAALEAEKLSADAQARIRIQHTTEVVEMDEKPSIALRRKKDSSMRVAIDLVKSGEADACVSSGNTGALMAIGYFVLKTIPGIARPAIATRIPRKGGWTLLLDLGANLESSSVHLYQFGLMGEATSLCIGGISEPRIGLLNIGEEDAKGGEIVRAAAALFKESQMNYQGFVEGNDIYTGDMDVIVCDGFVGNVTVKASEGLAQMIGSHLKESFSRNLFTKFAALVAMPILNNIKEKFDHRRYNGATLVGLNGVVVKSHGSMDAFGFEQAIKVAIKEAEEGIIDRIKTRLLSTSN